jgi:hypothetical protein
MPGPARPDPDAPDPETQDLRATQARREAEELRQVAEADTGEEADEHARRADKAGYLKEKLEERAEAEREPRD